MSLLAFAPLRRTLPNVGKMEGHNIRSLPAIWAIKCNYKFIKKTSDQTCKGLGSEPPVATRRVPNAVHNIYPSTHLRKKLDKPEQATLLSQQHAKV